MIISITGTLPVSRKRAVQIATAKGWRYSKNVTRQCHALIVGDYPGEGLVQAQRLGIAILSPSDLIGA